MGPPITAVFVRSGFHCNATLRFESTVIPFSNYLIVMYDSGKCGNSAYPKVAVLQYLYYSCTSVRAMVQSMSRRLQRI